jgi:hypothetical protein
LVIEDALSRCKPGQRLRQYVETDDMTGRRVVG